MMGKHETPPLRMVVEGGRLAPASAYDAERLDTYKNGSVLQVSLWQGRNAKLSRKYWAILHRVVADLPCPWQSAEEASDALKLALGITEAGKTIHDKWFIRPGSVSFASMDEAKFQDFFEKAMAVLEKVTGVDPLTLQAESADTGDDEHPSDADPLCGSDKGDAAAPASQDGIPTNTADDAAGEAGPDEAAHGETAAPASPSIDEPEWLRSFARAMVAAIGPDETVAVNQSKGLFLAGLSEETRSRARAITNYIRAVCRNEMEKADAIEIIAGKAGCEAKEIAG